MAAEEPAAAEAAGDDWDCGKVDWNVPEEERGIGSAGKLVAPTLEFKEHESKLANVGKLKNPFAEAQAEVAAPPAKRSWKKK